MDKEEYKRQTQQRDKQAREKSLRECWFGWWKTPSDRFAFFITLFTAALAMVAYFQFEAMRSTDNAIHLQLEEMKKAYGPLKDSADAATKTAVVAEQALTPGQRSWVSLKSCGSQATSFGVPGKRLSRQANVLRLSRRVQF